MGIYFNSDKKHLKAPSGRLDSVDACAKTEMKWEAASVEKSLLKRHCRAWVAALAGLSLAACSGGGGGGGSTSTPAPVAPIRPTDAQAGRFLTQATFGPTDATLADVKANGITAWVVTQEAMAPSASHRAFVDARLTQLLVANAKARLTPTEFYESFWSQAATAPDQLRQRVKLALSEIFVVSLADPTVDPRGAASYYDMLGANAFGNYRTLLEQVTLHPMMGDYLSYIANQKEDPTTGRHPDENYAREVEQLMSIGLYQLNLDGSVKTDSTGAPIPTYSSTDIQGLAKVFTGFSWYSPTPTNTTFFGGSRDPNASITPMIAYPAFHSISSKTFLGVTIPATATPDPAGDLKIALDTLFNHPNVGPFIGKQLIQHLVTSNPSPAYISRVAGVFNDNGHGVRGDLGAVVQAVLTDPDALDITATSSPTFGKLREPLVRVGNWMRAFNATSQSGSWLISSTSANTSFSQSALTAPSVFNFFRPGYSPPNTRLGAAKLVAPEFQIVDEVSTVGYINTLQTTIDRGIGGTPPGGSGADVQSAYANEVAIANDANALADRMNLLLLYGQMSAGLRARIVESVTGIAVPGGTATQAQITAAQTNRAKLAIFMTMVSPEYLAQR